MHRRSALGLALLALPLLAGCGSAAAGVQAGSSTPPATTQQAPTPDPADLVLMPKDTGPSYLVIAKQTKPVPLAVELKHEGPAAIAADRRSYLGGYRSELAQANVSVIVSTASVYRNAADATIAGADPPSLQKFLQQIRGHVTAVPANAPGTHRIALVGSIPLKHGGSFPVAVLRWQHGRVLELTALFAADVSPAKVAALAKIQDAKVSTS